MSLLHKYIKVISRSVFLHVFVQDFDAYWSNTVLALHEPSRQLSSSYRKLVLQEML